MAHTVPASTPIVIGSQPHSFSGFATDATAGLETLDAGA
jgi:hypothetical protein